MSSKPYFCVFSCLAASFVAAQDVPSLFMIDRAKWQAAYEKGRDEGSNGMTVEKLVDRLKVSLGNVRAPGSWHWTAPYAILADPRTNLEVTGLTKARAYEKDDADALFGPLAPQPMSPAKSPYDSVTVLAYLYAWPGTRGLANRHIDRAANKADVEDVKFALLPDGDASKAILPGDIKENNQTDINGQVAVPQYNTATSSTSTVGPGGVYSSQSTVSYLTYNVMGYDAYQATYTLKFPLFDGEKSNVPPGTKTLVIKVIYPSGEHSAVFKIDSK